MANRGRAKTRQSTRKTKSGASTRAGQAATRGRTKSGRAADQATRPSRRAKTPKASARPSRSGGSRASSRAASPAPTRRPSYAEAVALYEQAMHWVQEHEYAKAAQLLHKLIDDFPEEKELHDRAALYLNVCEKQGATAPEKAPQSTEERLYAATIALNAGEFGAALDLLGPVIKQQPENDHAHYVRAVAFSLSGRVADAIESLGRAVALNAENRLMARQDADLEALRHDERSRKVLEGPTGDRVRTARRR